MQIEGILFDLDGVFYIDDALIPGAAETLRFIKHSGLPYRFITNTSTLPPEAVAAKLRRLGLAVDSAHIFSAISATEQWLKRLEVERVALLLAEPLRERFARDFTLDEVAPEAVVIGDIGARWDYALLNRVFNWLMQGARLLCVHRNRFWQTGNGLQLDIGAFVAGLEYAAGVEAVVAGKPSRLFFDSACQALGLPAERVAVVGDDIESDIGGAQGCGCLGVLVRSGKYRAEFVARSAIRPDAEIDSIADLPALLTGRAGR